MLPPESPEAVRVSRRLEPDPSHLDTLELDARFPEDGCRISCEPVTTLLDRLRQSSTEWRDTVDALGDLIFMVDERGRVLRTNRTFESWGLGSVRAVADQDLHSLVHPRCADPASCYLKRAWRTFVEHSEHRRPHAVETEDPQLERFVELSLHRIGEGSEATQGSRRSFAVVVLRDVTETHRERLRQWHREHTETIETMARGLAHEVGNPLAAMKTSLQVLHGNFDTFDDAKKRLYVERVLESTNRVWSIVEQILHGPSRQVHELKPLEVGEVLESARDIFGDQAADRGVEIEVDVPRDEAYLLADPTALNEVLDNLLSNSLDACGEGDLIELKARCREDAVLVSVRDSGCGIHRRDIGKVFQPFFTTKRRGSGIGMIHTAHLIQVMGGRISVDSAEGVGTEVLLTLERADHRS